MRLWRQQNLDYDYEFIITIGREYHTIELKGIDYTEEDTRDY